MTPAERAALAAALEHTRRLTARQAAILLGVSPNRAGQMLRRFVDEGLAVRIRDGYWHPAADRRLGRHQELVAEAYVALAHANPSPRWQRPPDGTVRPDALLELPADLVAFEADTGTERGDDWPVKLQAYIRSPYRRILVVTYRPGRAQRLEATAAGYPVQLVACTPADLSRVWPTFVGAAPPRPADSPVGGASLAPRPTAWLAEQPLEPTDVAHLVARGYRVLRERRAGRDEARLVAPPSRAADLWRRIVRRGRNRAPDNEPPKHAK